MVRRVLDVLGLTVFGLEISMQDHGSSRVAGRLRVSDKPHDIAACLRRVFAIVAAVQSAHDLAEDAPHELLLADLVLALQVADDPAQIAIAAIFHVQMQILRGLDVVALEVGHDVGVPELL